MIVIKPINGQTLRVNFQNKKKRKSLVKQDILQGFYMCNVTQKRVIFCHSEGTKPQNTEGSIFLQKSH